ncbi:MAG: hypothetical protein LUD80_00885 [Clostridiales bacterium]|nr:hypothetical protein [Clostridiales bacterium]
MDLKNGTVTIDELAKNPRAVALLNQYDPTLIHHPMAPVVRGWTINQAVSFARRQGAREEDIRAVLSQLEAL